MIMDFPKQGHALVIVAHPDDEILECATIKMISLLFLSSRSLSSGIFFKPHFERGYLISATFRFFLIIEPNERFF